jgi:dolichol-phosphate mannosyltransferase
MPKLLVFTATYNESGTIGRLIDEIASAAPAADVLIVDDNSPDGTWDIVQEKRKTVRQLVGVRRPRKLGIGSAHKYGILYAMREGYDVLVTMDADFSHPPSAIPSLLAVAGPNIFVTGSRYCPGGKSDYRGYRAFISVLGNLAARTLLSLPLHEVTTSFRVFDVESLRRLPLHQLKSDGYGFSVELVYLLKRARVELREVPIHFEDRRHGQSKIPPLQAVTSGLELARLALSRLSRQDLRPDVLPGHACPNCDDRALALTKVGPVPADRKYKCLNCGLDVVELG